MVGIAIVPSDNQGEQLLWHIDNPEKDNTLLELGYIPLQLQAGVMFVGRNERTKAFFHAWYDEYCKYGDEDQAAFLRALNRLPLKIPPLSSIALTLSSLKSWRKVCSSCSHSAKLRNGRIITVHSLRPG